MIWCRTTGVWSIECKDEQASTPAHPLPNLSHHRGSIGGAIFNDAIPTTPTLSSTPHLSHDNDGGHGGVSSSVVKVVYKGRALVCADGATSRLARSLGVVHSEPTAVCSRSYVQVPHAFKWDGMLFYPPSILPGCCAIVRHVGGELSYMTFINPAMGGQVCSIFIFYFIYILLFFFSPFFVIELKIYSLLGKGR